MSITIGLFGHNEWGIRLAAVICGLLTLLFTYLWIDAPSINAPLSWRRRCWRSTSGRCSLSRVGLRAASVPMMVSLVVWLYFRGSQVPEARSQPKRRYAPFVFAGAALGLALYTYPAARTLPVVFFLSGFWIRSSRGESINPCSSRC